MNNKSVWGRAISFGFKYIKDNWGSNKQIQLQKENTENSFKANRVPGISQIFQDIKINFQDIAAKTIVLLQLKTWSSSIMTKKSDKCPSIASPLTISKRDLSAKAPTKSPKKSCKIPTGAKKPDRRVVKVYRFDGINCKDAKPRYQTFAVDINKVGFMVLDLLIFLRKMDPSLSFRRSCREGICGSCAINLQGSNCLACIVTIPKEKTIVIHPLPHMYVIRDLVVDMDHFIAAYNSVRPYNIREEATDATLGKFMYAQSQTDQMKMDGLYECVLCACCATACPSYWWNGRRFLGPAALLHQYRWIIDSRDADAKERLRLLRDDFTAFRCHTIMNCTIVCPKGLNPALAIAKLKRLIAGLDRKPAPELNPLVLDNMGAELIKGKAKYE